MYYNRIIPCLLLQNQGLVKTINFSKPRYIGDPINAVRIFNDKEVDELIFLDINATKEKREPNYQFLKKICDQCFMPLCYGGGIKSFDEVKRLFDIGFEKVSVNAAAYRNKELINKCADFFGSQSIVGAMDVAKDFFGKKKVFVENGTINTKLDPREYAKHLEDSGIGELFINSIDNDGMMSGYDLELIHNISSSVRIPTIVCGGAKNLQDCARAIDAGASAVAAGSMFVFWGRNRAVLINYPNTSDIEATFSSN